MLMEQEWVTVLENQLEEASRATQEGVKRFVEPAANTLRRAYNKRPHLIFGRRGSGKSSLMRKAASELTLKRTPISFVDLETFKGHAYPDVLVSILIESFKSFANWLETAGVHPASKTTFWRKFFGRKPDAKPLDKRKAKRLADELREMVEELQQVLDSPLATERAVRSNDVDSHSDQRNFSAAARKGPLTGSASSESQRRSESSLEIADEYATSKEEHLHRNILSYQEKFREMAELAGSDSFLFLDDLYYIRRSDQARVLDYFHRIGKSGRLWIKVGTIRFRSTWYVHGDPPIGLKLGDDADDIDLDVTLEKFDSAKRFLIRVLDSFLPEGRTPNTFMTDGALDRLVLASGGVARDFLGILRKAIAVARERGNTHRGERIFAEDVNAASGEYDRSKRDELSRDTLDEEADLNRRFQSIRDFCTKKSKTNVFLVAQDAPDELLSSVNELVDLRLIHKIRSRVTVKSGRAGESFEAFMMDVSQYTAARKTRDMEIIEFWTSEGDDKLRRAKLIYEEASAEL